MKVERVSYDVITPSAARGILEAIYWKPQICWIVERIHVLQPIRFATMKRNEVSKKIPVNDVSDAIQHGSGSLGLQIDELDSEAKLKYRQPRAATILRDVGYVIEARFDIVDGERNAAKHLDQFNRRARRGQCFHHPYLGTREFPASFALVEEPEYPMPACELPEDQRNRDLGYMLHDLDYAPAGDETKAPYDLIESSAGRKLTATPRFFHAEIRDGVIDVPPFESEEVKR
jgi:CRISPR-associated protein Cas5d